MVLCLVGFDGAMAYVTGEINKGDKIIFSFITIIILYAVIIGIMISGAKNGFVSDGIPFVSIMDKAQFWNSAYLCYRTNNNRLYWHFYNAKINVLGNVKESIMPFTKTNKLIDPYEGIYFQDFLKNGSPKHSNIKGISFIILCHLGIIGLGIVCYMELFAIQ